MASWASASRSGLLQLHPELNRQGVDGVQGFRVQSLGALQFGFCVQGFKVWGLGFRGGSFAGTKKPTYKYYAIHAKRQPRLPFQE